MRTLCKLAVVFVLLGVSCAHADNLRDVNIYSFLTEAGKQLVPPTADHPATYLLISAGYKEEGELVAGEKSPDPKKVATLVRKALSNAHYIGVKKDSKELDLIVVYYWGYMNPQIDESADDDETPSINFNGASMVALVAGNSMDQMTPNTSTWQDTIAASEESRYFVFIAAYSPAAYVNKHQKKLLWRAQMSVASNGVNLDQSINALVDSSVNYLGRATETPQQVNMDLDRTAHVDIGTPEVEEYIPTIDMSKPKDAPKKP
jgi:hypothetical protein